MTLNLEAVSWFSVIVAQHIDIKDIEEYQVEVNLDYTAPVKYEEQKKVVVGLGWIREQLQNAMYELAQIAIPEN